MKNKIVGKQLKQEIKRGSLAKTESFVSQSRQALPLM
jgi:hypothetical protein